MERKARIAKLLHYRRALPLQFGLLVIVSLVACSPLRPPSGGASLGTQRDIKTRIDTSADDAEEIAEGAMNLDSDNLKFTTGKDDQLVGMRFTSLDIPRGAIVTEAHIQFQADKVSSEDTAIELRAQTIGDAPAFTADDNDLSSRALTAAVITWSPGAWTEKGDAEQAQRTPDLSAILQEVVDQPDWRRGNAVVFVARSRGDRIAKSFDGDAEGAPLLQAKYRDLEVAAIDTGELDADLGTLRAFPGAAGFGSDTVGGRGGRVIHVTNLNDNGPGSLRAAVEATGPRTVLFDVGGTITLHDRLSIRAENAYLTIAGQSAPGDGITLRGAGNNEPLMVLSDGAHDIVVRYLRFRKGPGGGQDNVSLNGSQGTIYNVVFDHNSFSWATDENINSYDDVHDVTFSWNIIAEPLHCSTHREGCHGKNGAMGKYATGSHSFHHNLIMSSHDRSLKLNQAYGVVDYVNNVHYNNYDMTYLHGDDIGSDKRGDFVGMNFIGNWYGYGPNSKNGGRYRPELDLKGAQEEKMQVFASGNLGPSRPDNSLHEWAIAAAGERFQAKARFDAPRVQTSSATVAYEQVLEKAGATLPRRDLVDVRLSEEVQREAGQWVDGPEEVGGWPVLRSGKLPQDSDGDGMPDSWETARGLNARAADDAGDRDGDGYTNLEEYLAWLER